MENPNFGGLMIYKVCSFFGHRNASLTECERTKLIYVIEELIQGGVTKFLFGSRSDFDSLCHEIVHDFKQKYTEVKEMAFVCLSESVILESEKEEWEKIYSHFNKESVNLKCFDEMVRHKTVVKSGRASYVERNKEMIDNSDYCVFYYDENYRLPKKRALNGLSEYTPKSGTKIAFDYAKQKNKIIINIKE